MSSDDPKERAMPDIRTRFEAYLGRLADVARNADDVIGLAV